MDGDPLSLFAQCAEQKRRFIQRQAESALISFIYCALLAELIKDELWYLEQRSNIPPIIKVAPIKKRMAPHKRFQASREWKELRALARRELPPSCAVCGATDSLQVDHVKPKSRFPELALDIGNLQILCWPCNRKKAATWF